MKTLIRGAPLGGRSEEACALMVEGTRIVALLDASDAASASADRRIDLPDVTLAPGLIDAHVHLSMNAAESHAAVWQGLRSPARPAHGCAGSCASPSSARPVKGQ